MATMDIQDQWLWDRRIDKAYYPIRTDGDTVTLLTVWHRDEVAGAVEHGALDPVDAVGGEDEGFDHFDSFRILDDAELDAFGADPDE